jgi:hypothetical protein
LGCRAVVDLAFEHLTIAQAFVPKQRLPKTGSDERASFSGK